MAEKAISRQSLLKQEEEFLKRFSLRKFTLPREVLTDCSTFLNRPKHNTTNSDRSTQQRFRIEYKELKKSLNTNMPWWLRAIEREDISSERLAILVEEPKKKDSSSKRLIPYVKEEENASFKQTDDDFLNVSEKSEKKTDKCELNDISCIERRLSKVLRVLDDLEYARLDSGCDKCQEKCQNNGKRKTNNTSKASQNACSTRSLCICDLEDVDMEIEHLCNCLAKSLECQTRDKCYYKDIMQRLNKIRKSLNEFMKKVTSSGGPFIPEKLEKIEYFMDPAGQQCQCKAEKAISASKKDKPKATKSQGCSCFGGKVSMENECDVPTNNKKSKSKGKANSSKAKPQQRDEECFEPIVDICSADMQKALCVCCTEKQNDGQGATFDFEACFPGADKWKTKNTRSRSSQECKVEQTSNDRRFCNDLVKCMGIGQCCKDTTQKDNRKCDQSLARINTGYQVKECICPCEQNRRQKINAEENCSVRSIPREANDRANRSHRHHISFNNMEVCEDPREDQQNKRRTKQFHTEIDQQGCEESMAQESGQMKCESEVPLKRHTSHQSIKNEHTTGLSNIPRECISIEPSRTSIKQNDPLLTMMTECVEANTVMDTIENCDDTTAMQHYNDQPVTVETAQNGQEIETNIELFHENIPCKDNENISEKKSSKSTKDESNLNKSERMIRICSEKKHKLYKAPEKIRLSPVNDKGMLSNDFCYDCFGKNVPIIKKNLAGEIRKIIGNRKRNSVFLKFTVFQCNLYHMQMCTDNDYLGCLYATESATFEARNDHGFDGCITLTVTSSFNTLAQIECLVDHAFMVVQQEKRNSY